MTTIIKYREAIAAHFRRSRVAAWGLFAVYVALFLLAWAGLQFLDREGSPPNWAVVVLLASLPLSFLFVGGLAGWCNQRRSHDDPRLICPNCAGPIQMYGAIVIASRNCPHCGSRVLAD